MFSIFRAEKRTVNTQRDDRFLERSSGWASAAHSIQEDPAGTRGPNRDAFFIVHVSSPSLSAVETQDTPMRGPCLHLSPT